MKQPKRSIGTMSATVTFPPSVRRGTLTQSSAYDLGDGRWLFVPTEAMHALHDASKPDAILERLGYRFDLWRSWMRSYAPTRPWLRGWLYSHPTPLPEEAGDFSPSAEMLAFRKAATAAALCATVREEGWHVSPSLVCWWGEKYEAHSWFRGWLLRGEDEPDEITVPRARMVRYAAAWWNYPAHYREARRRLRQRGRGTGPHPGAGKYREWITSAPSMRDWFFGNREPPGVYVVSGGLQRFRAESCHKNICKAAEVPRSSIAKWQREYPAAFEAIRERIARGGTLDGPGSWDALPTLVRDEVAAFAGAATLVARCERAGIMVEAYYSCLSKAHLVGAREDLERYLRSEGSWREYGLVTPKLFVPSALMLKFRDSAEEAKGADRNCRDQLPKLSGFRLWFEDWTNPAKWKGRRRGEITQPPDMGPVPATTDESLIARAGGENRPQVQVSEPPNASASAKPRWDEAKRELWLGEVLVRRFDREARNQFALLAAFEAAQWDKSVSAFLDRGAFLQTIKDLNRTLKDTSLRFGQTDKGGRATWGLR
jgi:hypothetical protein